MHRRTASRIKDTTTLISIRLLCPSYLHRYNTRSSRDTAELATASRTKARTPLYQSLKSGRLSSFMQVVGWSFNKPSIQNSHRPMWKPGREFQYGEAIPTTITTVTANRYSADTTIRNLLMVVKSDVYASNLTLELSSKLCRVCLCPELSSNLCPVKLFCVVDQLKPCTVYIYVYQGSADSEYKTISQKHVLINLRFINERCFISSAHIYVLTTQHICYYSIDLLATLINV